MYRMFKDCESAGTFRACADQKVVDTYKAEGFRMLLRVFNETDYLEKLTGLDELYKESEAVLDSLEWEEGSEEDF